MFENESFDNILKRMLDNMPTDIDKREGSIAYDAVAPAAKEFEDAYIRLEGSLLEAFADTASRDYLIRRAKEQGIYIEGASAAVYVGTFNIEVPIGARFNMDKLNFVVLEPLGNFDYLLVCETAGTVGNNSIGTLLPIDHIDGLTSAKLVELKYPGKDEEGTEEFRERYFNEVDKDAIGGNRADYIETVKQITRGQVKVYRTPNNVGGTVRVVITDSENQIADRDLLNQVKEELDPVEHEGLGYGLMPVGHEVTVETVKHRDIYINAQWETEAGATVTLDDVEAAITAYIGEVNKEWENRKTLRLYTAHIISRILAINGVINVVNVTIDGSNQYVDTKEDEIFGNITLSS